MFASGWQQDDWAVQVVPYVTDALRPLLEAAVGIDLINRRLPRWQATCAPLVQGAAAEDLTLFLAKALPLVTWRPRPGYFGPDAVARNISDTNFQSLGAVLIAASHLGECAPFEELTTFGTRAYEKLPHCGVPAADLGRCTAFALGRLGARGGYALLQIRPTLRNVPPRKVVDAAVANVMAETGLELDALHTLPASGDTLDGLFAAARAAPGDDAPRLVLSDLLQEQGDPRGEFIRLQIQGNQRAANRLLKAHRATWLAPFEGDVSFASAVFERGFPVQVKLSHGRYVTPGPHWATIERLDAGRDAGLGIFLKMYEEGTFPALRRVLGVDTRAFMKPCDLPGVAFRRVNRAPEFVFGSSYIRNLQQLRWLDLTDFPAMEPAMLEGVQVPEVVVYSPTPETLLGNVPQIERLVVETELRAKNNHRAQGWFVVQEHGRLQAHLGAKPRGYDVEGSLERLTQRIPGLVDARSVASR